MERHVRESESATLRLLAAAEAAVDVESYRVPVEPKGQQRQTGPNVALEIRGRLRLPSEQAYDLVAERFRALGYVALLRRAPDGVVIEALPGVLPKGGSHARVAAALFVITVLSVLSVGGLEETADGGLGVNLLAGLPFAFSLLSILLAHEMGHYLVARRLGLPSSLPFFIPMPLSMFGTMGAVMQLQAPPRNRRALLALGAAGPIAGLAVALPVLLLGLFLSDVRPIADGANAFQEGNSLLYLALKYLVFGRMLPAGGLDVWLHPVALAGWAGLLVTALNLLPAGQLDGGHIAYALLGERARLLTWAVIAGLTALAIFWWGWLIWAGLAFAFARVHAVPLDDVSEPGPRWRVFAIAMLVLAALVFVPIPMQPL